MRKTVERLQKGFLDSILISYGWGHYRENIRPGLEVDIVLKKDQASGRLTHGIVRDILTNSQFHPHGIKVRLVSREVGRVKYLKSP